MKKIREEKGLSRRELADKIGVTVTALWKIENGKTRPKDMTINYFCFVLGIPLARLYTLAFDDRDFAPIPSINGIAEAIAASAFSLDDIRNALNSFKI